MEHPEIHWLSSDSAFGTMLIAVSETGLRRLSFGESGADWARRDTQARWIEGGAWVQDIAPTIEAFVAGEGEPNQPLPFALDSQGTPFQRRVWDYLLSIPSGETRTYADISRSLGLKGADRAVGSANGANPIAILIPCHRVIRSDGGLGGYAYGMEMKRALLRREGALGPDLLDGF